MCPRTLLTASVVFGQIVVLPVGTHGASARIAAIALNVAVGQAGFTKNEFAAVDQAIADDDYDSALRLLDALRSAARVSGDRQLQQEVAAYSRNVRRLRKADSSVSVYRKTLATMPNDGEANRVVGLFCCTVKGDWDAGLRQLAKCDDPVLRGIATMDLERGTDAESQLDVANAWWGFADSQSAKDRYPFVLRGRHWYLRARPGLDAVSRVEPDRRLSRIPLYADRIVVWNQHNAQAADRGAVQCVVTILDKGSTQRQIALTLPWSEGSRAWSTIRIPRTPVDQVRVDVITFRGRGGGLAEIEVFDGATNISRHCSAVANHYWEDDARFHPSSVTDGNTSGHDGIWLLNNAKPGWVLVDLATFVEQP